MADKNSPPPFMSSPSHNTAAVCLLPAVAEELLFRGFLLTALQQRLGAIDAAAVAAALFALIHLDIQQFFLYCVLGGACGLLAVRSGSVWPAVVLHAGFNATAVATALLLHR
jgi:membrane protease YdiL (CAAX protease family)